MEVGSGERKQGWTGYVVVKTNQNVPNFSFFHKYISGIWEIVLEPFVSRRFEVEIIETAIIIKGEIVNFFMQNVAQEEMNLT